MEGGGREGGEGRREGMEVDTDADQTVEQEVTSVERLWAADSIACHAACSLSALGAGGGRGGWDGQGGARGHSHTQAAWGASARLHEFVSLPVRL